MKRAALLSTALAVLAVAGLYLWARPGPAPVAATPATVAPAMAEPTAAEFEFDVAPGGVRGPLSLGVREGQRVTLRVRSEAPDELHVHGYELSAPLPAGEWVALTFVAARAGRFEVELHRAHRELGALEVQPR